MNILNSFKRGCIIIMIATKLFYFAKKLRKIHLGVIAKLIDWLIRIFFSAELHSTMQCGKNCCFAHNGLGIVINKNTEIGTNCLIFQNVTIGGRNGSGSPKIGNNVIIGAGAVVLGDIIIADGVRIGANAVVLNDIPENQVAVGVPAELKK